MTCTITLMNSVVWWHPMYYYNGDVETAWLLNNIMDIDPDNSDEGSRRSEYLPDSDTDDSSEDSDDD